VLRNKWIHICVGVVLEDSSHTQKLGIHLEADKARVGANSLKVNFFLKR